MNRPGLIGWSEGREAELAALGVSTLEPARVAAVDRGGYVLLSAGGPVAAVAAGRLEHEARAAIDLPAVGDWVVFSREAGLARIERILRRSSCLLRKTSGRSFEAQIIGANLDKIFIVTAVGRDLNPRRVQRYLAATLSAGSTPVVVVNKSDLPHHREDVLERLREITPLAPVVLASTVAEDGLAQLLALISPGETIALVGSSGVGKSSIVNRLAGDPGQTVKPVREADQKGRHATSRRELFMVDGRYALIDSPGMREFGLWDVSDSLDQIFPEIAELAGHCKFRDCSHTAEPGCAATQAVEAGLLPARRLETYLRLNAEQKDTAEHAAVRDGKETKRWKQISKAGRDREKLHRKLGLK